MLLEAIGGSLPMAVGVALSPLAITAVIVMLMSPRAETNVPAFLAGWILCILSVGAVTFVMPAIETAQGEPTAFSGAIRIVLGIGLLLLSRRQWRKRPGPDETVEAPKLLSRLDDIDMTQSLALGILLSGINPKNLVLIAAGAATIDTSMLAPKAQAIALLVFTAVASLTVAVPVAGYFLARGRADQMFGRWKAWLLGNNVTVLIVLLLVFGTLLISNGIEILAA